MRESGCLRKFLAARRYQLMVQVYRDGHLDIPTSDYDQLRSLRLELLLRSKDQTLIAETQRDQLMLRAIAHSGLMVNAKNPEDFYQSLVTRLDRVALFGAGDRAALLRAVESSDQQEALKGLWHSLVEAGYCTA